MGRYRGPVPEAASRIEAQAVLASRYRLVRRIDRGGMAEVWEGRDEVLDRPVAVKVLDPRLAGDEAFHERFRREAVSAARLAHPNVVGTYDTGIDAGVAFIVMELVSGQTLRDLLRDQSPLNPSQAVAIAAEVADALEYAHQAGIVHRDVKPGNILVSDDGRVKVADFGIAKAAVDSDLTQQGTFVGTAKYLPPEQVEGRPQDRRSDVYGLGVVLYEMLCGRPPFQADSDMAVALQHVHAEPMRPRQLRPGIPRSLERVVLKAMSKDPEARYATAAELRRDLLAISLNDDATVAVDRETTPPGGTAPTFVQSERSWLVPVVLIVVLAVTLGVVGLIFARSETGKNLLDSGGSAKGQAVTLTGEPQAFDPDGNGQEHNADLSKLTDGNPSTGWSTERYNNEHFGGLKEGVGFSLTLDRSRRLTQLQLSSPSRGWSARVYVADGRKGALAEWGTPVTTRSDIAGDATFDLKGREGSAVLLWITDLGQGNSSVTVTEAKVTA
jgi:eukaryotic-like serine/threonine-protein kinase